MAFAVRDAARLLLSPTLTGGRPNDAAGFALRYGPLSCSPQWGFRRWASTRPVSRPSRQPATGPPGSYPDGIHTRRRQRAYVPDQANSNNHLQLPGALPVGRPAAASCARWHAPARPAEPGASAPNGGRLPRPGPRICCPGVGAMVRVLTQARAGDPNIQHALARRATRLAQARPRSTRACVPASRRSRCRRTVWWRRSRSNERHRGRRPPRGPGGDGQVPSRAVEVTARGRR